MLTIEKVIEHAEVVVALRGRDFVYNDQSTATCAYVPNTDPRFPGNTDELEPWASGSDVTGCIVGEILDRAGLLSDEVAQSRSDINSIVLCHKLPIHRDAINLLSAMQFEQDNGKSWGDILGRAKRFWDKG